MTFESDSLMKNGFSLKAARVNRSGQTETCESNAAMMECQPTLLRNAAKCKTECVCNTSG